MQEKVREKENQNRVKQL